MEHPHENKRTLEISMGICYETHTGNVLRGAKNASYLTTHAEMQHGVSEQSDKTYELLMSDYYGSSGSSSDSSDSDE